MLPRSVKRSFETVVLSGAGGVNAAGASTNSSSAASQNV
jgi:hypothetical protein